MLLSRLNRTAGFVLEGSKHCCKRLCSFQLEPVQERHTWGIGLRLYQTQLEPVQERHTWGIGLRLYQTQLQNFCTADKKWTRVLCKSYSGSSPCASLSCNCGIPWRHSGYCTDTHTKEHSTEKDSSSPHTREGSRSADQSQPEYRIFYRMAYIRHLHVISRLKLYQTGILVLGLPLVAMGNWVGLVPDVQLQFFVGITSLALLVLSLMSAYSRRVIGLLAISPDRQTVRVSHLTFWGGRRDILVPVRDIVPLSENPERLDDALIKFLRYDTNDYLFLSVRYGEVFDKDTFRLVFGDAR